MIMQLKKMVLRDEFEVMKQNEMKNVLGGDYIGSNNCKTDSCSGKCKSTLTHAETGEIIELEGTCKIFAGSLCACEISEYSAD